MIIKFWAGNPMGKYRKYVAIQSLFPQNNHTRLCTEELNITRNKKEVSDRCSSQSDDAKFHYMPNSVSSRFYKKSNLLFNG
jgi:hypothetical protein